MIVCWVVTAILSTITGAITPFIDSRILSAITEFVPNEIVVFLCISLAIKLFDSLVNYFSMLISERLENDIILNLKRDFAKILYKLEVKNFDKEGTGLFADRINMEPSSIAYGVYNLRHRFISLLSSAGVFVFLIVISWEITLLIFILSFLSILVERIRIKIWENYRKENDTLREENYSIFSEFIRGVRDIKVLNISDYVIDKIYNSQKNIHEHDFNHLKKTRFFSNFSFVFTSLSTFLVMILGIYLINIDRMSAANLIVVYMYLNRAYNFFYEITSINDAIARLDVSIDRLCELTENEIYPQEKFGDTVVDKLKGNIEFKNVNFSYTEDKKVLKNVNFKIDANTTVAFVGESGQGKTTIFNIISKLYSTSDNTVFIDGYDINTLSEDSLRNNISIITQNPYLFNVSIKENLKMVNPSISDKELKKRIKECSLDDFVNNLKDKFDTKIGEGGFTISGGQRQRLALARTLIKDSSIVLLDEATSALDNKTQEKIQNTIKEISKEKTVLIIAHRLSTIIKCDKIFVVDKGRIVGVGTHKELSRNCKVYKDLYEGEKF